MKPRYIIAAVGLAIILIAIACAMEIGRRDGKATLNKTVAGTATITEVTPAPSPWSVVCDNQGHYTFTDEDGDIWPISEWSTYEEAMLYCVTIKKLRESYRHGNTTDEERRRYKEIAARKWEACPP